MAKSANQTRWPGVTQEIVLKDSSTHSLRVAFHKEIRIGSTELGQGLELINDCTDLSFHVIFPIRTPIWP